MEHQASVDIAFDYCTDESVGVSTSGLSMAKASLWMIEDNIGHVHTFSQSFNHHSMIRALNMTFLPCLIPGCGADLLCCCCSVIIITENMGNGIKTQAASTFFRGNWHLSCPEPFWHTDFVVIQLTRTVWVKKFPSLMLTDCTLACLLSGLHVTLAALTPLLLYSGNK